MSQCNFLGSDVSRLDSFVTAYYDTTSSAGQGPILKSSTQKLDSHFLTYVWNRLIEQEEIRIAVIEPIDPSENGSVEPEKLKKGKGKAKAKVVESTERLRDLTEEEIESGKEFLVEKFGEDLRIVTSGDATWAAITGSHERVSSFDHPTVATHRLIGEV